MILDKLIQHYGIDGINSLTKYPSILTYHELGEKGMLKEEVMEGQYFEADADYWITEKIDGTNSRIILLQEDYLIGSRENFLYARGDRFGDPALNIVNTVKPVAEALLENRERRKDELCIIYGETYGGTVTAASKQYTENRTYGFRIFDIVSMNMDTVKEQLKKTIDQISTWREHNGQRFADIEELNRWVKEIVNIQTVPYVKKIKGSEIPIDRKSVWEWMQQFSVTNAGINYTGKAEGIVVRNFDRSLVRKIRFEDYERTQKKGGF